MHTESALQDGQSAALIDVGVHPTSSENLTREEKLRQQIEVEEVKRVHTQTSAASSAALVAVGLVTLVLWNVVSHTLLLIWATLQGAINVNNLLMTRRFPADSLTVDQSRHWRTRRIVRAGIAGCLWGALAVFLFPHDSPTHQIFIVFTFGGMGIGGVMGSAPLLKAYWAYSLPMAIPLVIQLLLHGGPAALTMALMVTSCVIFLLHSARQVHGYVSDSIRLRFENLDLIHSLSSAKEQTEEANKALRGEIIERQHAEARIAASLQEKEVLLQEIHHRVKNNLQIISSLLNLQARSIVHPDALTAFKDSQSRVRSMALIHEKLYQARDLARIDFGAYVRELAAYLLRAYQKNDAPIRLHIDIHDIFLSIETAVPCGLIISELVSNALKHAFNAGRKTGAIEISLQPDTKKTYILQVRDDGVGFPPHLDFRQASSLGLRIVNILAEQLGGAISLHNDAGAVFTLRLPAEEKEAEHESGAHLSR